LQSARRGLDLPVLGVAVAVEHDGTVLGDDALEHLLHRFVEVGALASMPLELGGDEVERVGHDRVDRDQRPAIDCDEPGHGTRSGCR
jgi:hypothetical protein